MSEVDVCPGKEGKLQLPHLDRPPQAGVGWWSTLAGQVRALDPRQKHWVGPE